MATCQEKTKLNDKPINRHVSRNTNIFSPPNSHHQNARASKCRNSLAKVSVERLCTVDQSLWGEVIRYDDAMRFHVIATDRVRTLRCE
jgi:hypothetical protein